MKLGVIGYGARVKGLIDYVFPEAAPELRVVGVVDPDREAARARLPERDRGNAIFCENLAEMVRRVRPDALMIGTRCNLHTPYALEAARYDIPLYLEKPVATSMVQAVSLEKAFRKSRCSVVVSFPLRVSPLCVLARQFLDKGAVGSREHVAAVNYVPYGTIYWEEGYRNYQVTQGLFLQKATHDFDYISLLMGSPIVRVAAMATVGRVFGGKKKAQLRCSQCGEASACLESPGNRRRNRSGGSQSDHLCVYSVDCGRVPKRGTPRLGGPSPAAGMNEDSSSALLEFASGAHGVYTQVFFARRDAGARGATVSGYKGTLGFDWYRNELRYVRHHEPFSEIVRADEGLSHFGGDTELALDFVNLVKGKGKSRSSIRDGVQSVYACLAAKESAATGRFVKVRQVE